MRMHLVLVALVAVSPACKKKSKGVDQEKKPTTTQPQPDKKPDGDKTAGAGDKAAAPKADKPATPPAKVKPLLWKMTKGSAKPSYLFGTFHAEVGMDEMPESVLKAVDGSTAFVMEADQSKMDQGELMKLMMLPPNKSLDKELPADKFKKLVQLTGMPEAGLKKMRPWFVALTLALKFYTIGVPIDMQLRQRAQTAGKPVHFLEGWRAAIDVLTTGTAKDLIELIDDYDGSKKKARDLLDAYRAGDEARVIKAVFDPKEMKKNPKLFEGLFYKRNKAWVPKIEKHAATGGAFIAVGAGHIVGKDGLIDLLGKKGYKFERISQ